MVLDGEKARYEFAVCCRVDVVKGAFGFFSISVSFDDKTLKSFSVAQTSSTLSFSFSSKTSPGYLMFIKWLILSFVSAEIFQYFSGVKADISRSLSANILRAGDCTLPAESPYQSLVHKSPESP